MVTFKLLFVYDQLKMAYFIRLLLWKDSQTKLLIQHNNKLKLKRYID